MARPTAPSRKRTRRRARRRPDYLANLIAFAGTWRGEAAFVAALFALALVVRWPYLQLLPHFTDEINEVMTALKISRGQAFPLTAQETITYGQKNQQEAIIAKAVTEMPATSRNAINRLA